MQTDVEEEVQGARLLKQISGLRFAGYRVGAPLIPLARHEPHRLGNGEVPDAWLGRGSGVQ